jgi:hypothetical protein
MESTTKGVESRAGRRQFTPADFLIVVLAALLLGGALLWSADRQRQERRAESRLKAAAAAETREAAAVGICLKNVQSLLTAIRAHEREQGRLPVDGRGGPGWMAQVRPYLTGDTAVFLCPSDRSNGKVHGRNANEPSSYGYLYGPSRLGPGGKYRNPSRTAPLITCGAHLHYPVIAGRHDGTVELIGPLDHGIRLEFDD